MTIESLLAEIEKEITNYTFEKRTTPDYRVEHNLKYRISALKQAIDIINKHTAGMVLVPVEPTNRECMAIEYAVNESPLIDQFERLDGYSFWKDIMYRHKVQGDDNG